MHHLAEERLISAAQEVAHAQVAFDLTMDYILERKAFGKPIGAFQHSRFKMAEMRTSLDILQTFIDQCVLLHNQGELSAELGAEAKLAASELENAVMDTYVRIPDFTYVHRCAGFAYLCRQF
jgi:acyl-CoA dehydrogenase